MRLLKLYLIVLSLIIGAAGLRNQLNHASRASLLADDQAKSSSAKTNEVIVKTNVSSDNSGRYVLDASQSKFFVHALAGGLLWFKGHDHLIAVREFTGVAQLTPNSIQPASLVITAKTASLVETSSVFTEPQKQIINKELREIVLLPIDILKLFLKARASPASQRAIISTT